LKASWKEIDSEWCGCAVSPIAGQYGESGTEE